MAVSREQVEVYQIIFNMIMKAIFGLVVLGVFIYIIIMYFSLEDPKWAQTVPLASLEAILAGTLFVAYRHYFPSTKADS